MLPQQSAGTGCIDDEPRTNTNRFVLPFTFQQPMTVCFFDDVHQPRRIEQGNVGSRYFTSQERIDIGPIPMGTLVLRLRVKHESHKRGRLCYGCEQ